MLAGGIASLSLDCLDSAATFNLRRACKITFHIFIIGGTVPACLKRVDLFSGSCFHEIDPQVSVERYTRVKKVIDNLTISNEELGNESI